MNHASTDDVTRDHDIEGLKEHLLHEAKNIVSDNMETIVTVSIIIIVVIEAIL